MGTYHFSVKIFNSFSYDSKPQILTMAQRPSIIFLLYTSQSTIICYPPPSLSSDHTGSLAVSRTCQVCCGLGPLYFFSLLRNLFSYILIIFPSLLSGLSSNISLSKMLFMQLHVSNTPHHFVSPCLHSIFHLRNITYLPSKYSVRM